LYALIGCLQYGALGATFFGLREFLISPMLMTARQQEAVITPNALGDEGAQRLTWTEMRMSKLRDSMAAGFVTGGLHHGIRMSPSLRSVFRGAVTVSIFCGLAQLTFNQFGIWRLRHVSKSVSNVDRQSLEPKKHVLERLKDWLGPLVPVERNHRSLIDQEPESLQKRQEEVAEKLETVRKLIEARNRGQGNGQ